MWPGSSYMEYTATVQEGVVKLHLCFELSAIHQSCLLRDNVRAFRHKTSTLRHTINVSSQFERNPFASSEHTPREACHDQV